MHMGSNPLLKPGPQARSSGEVRTTDDHRICGQRCAQGHAVSAGLPYAPSTVLPPIRAVSESLGGREGALGEEGRNGAGGLT